MTRSHYILKAHGIPGLCRYYTSLLLYTAYRRIQEERNAARYRRAGPAPIDTQLFTGSPFRLPSGDAGIGVELMSGIREPNATRYLATLLRNDDVILDIGANIGYYVAVERHFAPGASIHAIEPVPANLALLRQNAPSGVTIHPVAISDHTGTDPIYIPDHCNWATLNRQHAGTLAGVHEVQVGVTTLDRFCEEHDLAPTFLRMDVEGSEAAILKGASNLIASGQPLKMMIELHALSRPPGEIETMVRDLLRVGFVIRRVIAEPNIKMGNGTKPLRRWYDILWNSLPGDTFDRLAYLMRDGFSPNVFLERR